METIKRLILLTILILLPVTAMALSPVPPTEGPKVPCVGCDNLTEAPYPETGIWANPEQSPGSGLSIEIRNGVLVGYLYSYTETGQPEWLIVTGSLVRSETPGVMWELDTHLFRVEGGSCLDCQFVPADQVTSGKRITLEFMQRNYLRIRTYTDSIGVSFDQFFVPFLYGSAAKAYFIEQTPYLMPVLGVEKFREPFLLSIRPFDGAETNPWLAHHVYIRGPVVSGDHESRVLVYDIWELQPNGPQIPEEIPPPYGVMRCALDEASGQPGCKIELEGVIYNMPIGNFGDSRFFAEADDGSIIEGFRIDYD